MSVSFSAMKCADAATAWIGFSSPRHHATHAYITRWGGGVAYVGSTDLGFSRLARVRKHIRGLANEFRMLTIVRRRNYDILQVKDLFLTAIIGLIAARLGQARFVYWLSYPLPEESLLKSRDGSARYRLFYLVRGKFFQFLLYRVIMPQADHVFVQSEQMKRDVIDMGVAREKLTAVPMGISMNELPAVPKAGASNESPPTVVYLGTLIKIRRMDFLIRSFSLVVEKMPEAHLLVIGAGDDPGDLEDLKILGRELGVSESIKFTGFLEIKKAWQMVANARVAVSPFYPTPILNSTSPTKLVEYLAIGKPVVANDHPEQRLVLEQSGGGLCVRYDEQEFANAILHLLRNPDLAERMGQAGRDYVMSHRDYTKIADRVEKKYREIVS